MQQILLLIALTLALLPLEALDPARGITQYGRDNWQSSQGLPQNTVAAIVQTGDGYLWIGTQEGLAQFDGLHFRVFNRSNIAAFTSQDIHALAAAPGGGLWIGTEDGLLHERDGKFERFTAKDGLRNSRVLALAFDREGVLWIGLRSGGICRRSNGKITCFEETAVARSNVWALAADPGSGMWAATGIGLLRFRDGIFRLTTVEGGLPSNLSSALTVPQPGMALVATVEGVARVMETSGAAPGAAPEVHILLHANARAVLQDAQQNVWVGTAGNGLLRVRGKSVVSYRKQDGLAADYVVSLAGDREGSLWIGTQGGGLDRLKDTRVVPFGPAEGIAGDNAKLVLERRTGSMLLATTDGIFERSSGADGTIKRLLPAGSIPYCMLEDQAGDLWFGMQDGTLRRLRNGYMTTFPFSAANSRELPFALYQDEHGNLWVGTTAGLKQFDGAQFTTFTRSNRGLPNNFVRAIETDGAGGLWLGTFGGGVAHFTPEKTDVFDKRRGLSSDLVESIHRDRHGAVWVGTADAGLNVINNGTIASVTSKSGLFDDRVFQILEDGAGTLWMGSNRGIYSLTRAEIEKVMHQRGAHIESNSVGEADGMRSAECNGGAQPSGWVARDGKLWFPTVKGFAVIDPEHHDKNLQPPPVLLQAVRIDGLPTAFATAASTPLSISPSVRAMEIDYAGLSYLSPSQNRFKYRLRGFNEDWVDAGSRRTAYFTHLSPGKYAFDVMGSNNDGVWSQAGASFSFTVLPRYYQTTWFAVLAVVSLTAFLWLLYRVRLNQVEERHSVTIAERSRVARELHDTLLQGFAGVSMQLDSIARRLKQKDEPQAAELDQVLKTVDRCLAEARDSVWDLRSPLLETKSLSQALASAAESASGQVPTHFEQSGRTRPVSIGQSQQLLRIAQEALQNALRHSGASAIQVKLAFGANDLVLSVRDNGKGLYGRHAALPANGRWGLVGMTERAKRIGGHLVVQEEPGGGTAVRVSVPLG